MRYLNTSLPKSSMTTLESLTFLRKGNLAGVRGTGQWETRGSTSASTRKLVKARLSSWAQWVEMLTRSSQLITVSGPHSTSSREILRPQAERKSWN